MWPATLKSGSSSWSCEDLRTHQDTESAEASFRTVKVTKVQIRRTTPSLRRRINPESWWQAWGYHYARIGGMHERAGLTSRRTFLRFVLFTHDHVWKPSSRLTRSIRMQLLWRFRIQFHVKPDYGQWINSKHPATVNNSACVKLKFHEKLSKTLMNGKHSSVPMIHFHAISLWLCQARWASFSNLYCTICCNSVGWVAMTFHVESVLSTLQQSRYTHCR